MIFVGDDWAEEHHDVYLMKETGKQLAARRLPEGLAGMNPPGESGDSSSCEGWSHVRRFDA
jgi:hypothetical protein